MKVSELMKDVTINADFEGFVSNDDYVLAINTGGESVTDPAEFDVLEMGIAGLDPQMNPKTQDKTYVRAGTSTMKTGNQRSFAVTADRYVGDTAQDYCLEYGVKYGTGSAAVTDYVYFNIKNGKGEKGKVAIVVNSDGGGNAGESAAVSIDLKKSGVKPTEYTYIPKAVQNTASKPSS